MFSYFSVVWNNPSSISIFFFGGVDHFSSRNENEAVRDGSTVYTIVYLGVNQQQMKIHILVGGYI